MKVLFVEYPKCSTCIKAKKWLEENMISFEDRHIVEQNPSAAELKEWHKRSGLPLKNFFNTSGMLYRSMNLKEQISNLSEEEQYALLAKNGMLVKRPLIVADNFVLVGFKQAQWEEKLKEE
ncbi:arsenate reductase family protein [Ructibacterium gallinarum]|uniref:Arsenate reductase family protein n=1 Tax=Ructibacterium gallinarum TaxID=2779355 RepID=A0A9D5M298_9FIRM|nr:arsenate reductase family protein [Ructibacterium gallinarum]MBE5039374.1 arsenate reductase family protein [Ructibacterium gallinarum]